MLPAITLALLMFPNLINSSDTDAARQPPALAVNTERANDHLRQRMDNFLTMAAQFGFSGTVHVSRNGDVLLHKAYGWRDRKNRVPMRLDTVLEIGSNTKQFTAAAILFLEQQNKLSVQDPIGRFFPDAPPEKVGITLHQVLTHTAGFPDYAGPDVEPVDRETVIHRIFNAPLKFQPGTQYSYSNAGYSLLAAVIEKVSGLGYEQFLAKNFFDPLELRDTGYVRPHWSNGRLAKGYSAGQDFDNPIVQ